MNDFFEIVLKVLVFIVITVCYCFLLKRVFPKYILKPRNNGSCALGRGIKKFKSEQERAVVYEPHPSLRKYIYQYALFTRSGFKYLFCNLDTKVFYAEYLVQMFDSRNRLLDTISVKDTPRGCGRSSEILLHADTSYIALTLKSVNDVRVYTGAHRYYRVKDLLIYTACTFACNFFAFICFASILDELFDEMFSRSVYLLENVDRFIIPSLIIAVVCTLLNISKGDKEGIRVVFNDRKH